jgi:WD40 repeat protein
MKKIIQYPIQRFSNFILIKINKFLFFFQNKSKQTRNPVSRWSIGSGSINEFAFSPDNILLAIVSQDGFLRIFNYEKMELVSYMKSYFGGLLCVRIFLN